MRYISHNFNSEDPNQLILFIDFLHGLEKVHDNKKFSNGNLNPCRESRFTIC